MSRVGAVLLVTGYLATTSVATIASGASSERNSSDRHTRVIGHGQIKFDGHSAEAWARAYHREVRAAERLRRLLAGRMEPLVWLVRGFDCIHSHEGTWDDAGAPYYGGLQMDLAFQRAYGGELLRRKGTADNWTPAEQISVAIRAHASRGFYPWPSTARMCGLIR